MDGRAIIGNFSPRATRGAYWTLCALIAVGCAMRHIAAGFALPVPWPDESSFIWQAISFQSHNTLFAPELNPLREVLWMPPGYMVVIGTLFKIFGMSFALARLVSLVCVIGAFLFFGAVVQKFPYPFAGLALLGIAFLSAPMTAIGNTARMDAMLLLMAAVSMFLLQRNFKFSAFAFISISPLIHPNGAFLCVAALGYVLAFKRRKNITQPDSEEFIHPNKNVNSLRKFILSVVILLASILCWGAYIAYIAKHRGDFLSDMASQFQHKGSQGIPLASIGNVVFVVVMGCIMYYGWRTRTLSPLLAWFGGAMWLLYGVSTEAWYECFYAVAFALLLQAALPVIVAFTRASFRTAHTTPMRSRVTALLIVCLALISYTSINFYKSFTGAPFSHWFGMGIERVGTPYINDDDRTAVKIYLSSIHPPPSPLLVQFIPEADALFFAGMETDSIKFCQGTFYPFNPDVYIFHRSRYIQGFMKERSDYYTSAIGAFNTDTVQELTARDSTEGWRALRRIKVQ